MDNFIDYYELLHVQPSAPAPVIKASYRAMMQKMDHHPDRGGDVAFAQQLNDAVQILCNPQARAQYDILYRQWQEYRVTNTAWGEPGGSPTRPANTRSTQDSGSQNRTDDTRHQHTALPSSPHCPFCKTRYDVVEKPRVSHNAYINTHRCTCCSGARTPLSSLPTTSTEELRKLYRREYQTDARVWETWPQTQPSLAELCDFSPAGCALIYPRSLAMGSVAMIETDLFNAICKVRHVNSITTISATIGLEFLTLDMQMTPGTLLSASA